MRIPIGLMCAAILAATAPFGHHGGPRIQQAMVRFSNRLVSQDSVSLAANNVVLFEKIPPGDETGYIALADSTVTFTLRGVGPDSMLTRINGVLLDQSRYTVTAINGADDRPVLELQRD